MTSKKLPALLSGVAADILSHVMLPLPGSVAAVLGETAAQALERRRRDRLEAFVDELRHAEVCIHDADEAAELALMLHRVDRAATEGTARVNLRLMAQVIHGQASLGRLVADEFLHYAELIASLRREEVVLLGTAHRESGAAQGESFALVKAGPVLLSTGFFRNEEHFVAVENALTRTGLVWAEPTVGGNNNFLTTPLFDDLIQLTEFQEAMLREGMTVGDGNPGTTGKP